MYYVNGKQVKEMLMKDSDGFLHRTLYGYLSNNRKFYSKDAAYESPLVDVHVYYKGNRVLTTPQFIKRSELRTTTITVVMNPTVDLKVANATQSGVTSFYGNSGSNPTFKLDPDVILSKPNANVYLLDNPSPTSQWTDTGSYSIIFGDYSFTEISASSVWRDCGFENASAYARNGSGTYDLCAVGGLSILPFANSNNAAYLNINFVDSPDVSSAFDGAQSLVHFGYLPKTTAETMGFTSTENPNGAAKESPDYWGWGCWADGQQWLWSDDELCEFFSSNGSTISQSDLNLITNTGITYGDTMHWRVYSIDISSKDITELVNNPTFHDGWIFGRNSSNEIVSNIYSLENRTLLAAINEAREVNRELEQSSGNIITIIVPYSQEGQGGQGSGEYMGEFIAELVSESMMSDFSTYVDQFFNISTQISETNCIYGDINIQVSATTGYLYCNNNFTVVATPQTSQTFNIGDNGTNIIYLGARGGDPTGSTTTNEIVSSITLSVSPSFTSDWFNTMINSERFKYYKLIPFITSQNEGRVNGGGTQIELS